MFGFSLIAHHVGHKGGLVCGSSSLTLETTAHIAGTASGATTSGTTASGAATDNATGFGHFMILRGNEIMLGFLDFQHIPKYSFSQRI